MSQSTSTSAQESQESLQTFLQLSARNKISCVVKEVKKCQLFSLIIMTTSGGQKITSVIDTCLLEDIGDIEEGQCVTACIKASNVMIATNTDAESFKISANKLQGTIKRAECNGNLTIQVEDFIMHSVVTPKAIKDMGLDTSNDNTKVVCLFTPYDVLISV
jgi:molybdopterin-binding protein